MGHTQAVQALILSKKKKKGQENCNCSQSLHTYAIALINCNFKSCQNFLSPWTEAWMKCEAERAPEPESWHFRPQGHKKRSFILIKNNFRCLANARARKWFDCWFTMLFYNYYNERFPQVISSQGQPTAAFYWPLS